MTEAAPPHSRPRATRILTAAAIVVPAVLLAVAAWHYHWMSDDGFINLRIVRNITSGHGPVFNPGERVEASTSPLWVAVLTLADIVLPLRLEWIAVLTGIALTVLGFLGLGYGAWVLHRDGDDARPFIPVGSLVLLAIAPTWKFASSGLENGLSVAWIGAVLVVVARWARGARLRWWHLLVIGLGPLVRPELGLLTLGVLLVVVATERRDGLRHAVATVAVTLALPVAYEIFRAGYYSALTPNSALAKEASRPYWSAGWAYLRHTVNPYWLWLPLLVVALAGYLPMLLDRAATSRARSVTVLFLLVGIADALYIVRVGGDFMQARLLLPALTMLCAPVAVLPLRRATAAALLIVPWALLAAVTLRSGDDGPRAFGPETTNAVTTADFGWNPGGPNRAWFDGRGVWFLQHRLPGTPKRPGPTVAAYGVGVESYALGPDVQVLDLLGLGDAFTSHLRLDRRGTVAHEKPLPFPWVVARTLRPGAPVTPADFQLPPLFLARAIDHPGTQPFDARVRDARVALTCGELRAFLARRRAPLTASRFVDNLAHAAGDTALRIAPEPRAARRQFCR